MRAIREPDCCGDSVVALVCAGVSSREWSCKESFSVVSLDLLKVIDMSQDADPFTSIYSDFELLLTELWKLPEKAMQITAINYMYLRIQNEKNNLDSQREDREGRKDTRCYKYPDVSNVGKYGQLASMDEDCHGPQKEERAVHGYTDLKCKYTSSCGSLVKRHMDGEHPSHQRHQVVPRPTSIRINRNIQANGERRHECHICGKSHRSEISLHVHLKAYHRDKETGCIILRYRFNYNHFRKICKWFLSL